MELKTLGQKVKGLFDGGEDRGVSPVIGVILMVAITVILAAVIGAFVLGLGDDLGGSQAPQLSTDITHSGHAGDGTLVISHNNGGSVDTEDLRVVVRNSDGTSAGSHNVVNANHVDSEPQFSTGDTIQLSTSDSTVLDLSAADYDVQVIHTPSDSVAASGSITIDAAPAAG